MKLLKISPYIFYIEVDFARVYLFKTKYGYIILDSGVPWKGKSLIMLLKKAKILKKITHIVLTHAHYDHAGNAALLKYETNADILIHKFDETKLTTGFLKNHTLKGVGLWGNFLLKFAPIINTSFETIIPDIIISKDMFLTKFGLDFKLIHTPGHTLGSISLIKGDIAFVGDLYMNRFPLRIKPGKTIFAEDKKLLTFSYKKVNKHNIKVVFPAHGKEFKIGFF